MASVFSALDRKKKPIAKLDSSFELKSKKTSISKLDSSFSSANKNHNSLEKSSLINAPITGLPLLSSVPKKKKPKLDSILRKQSFSNSMVAKPKRKPSPQLSNDKENKIINSNKRILPWETVKPINPRFKSTNGSSNSINAIPETFSKEQKLVVSKILNERKNVFFTGSAGTGKSYLLKFLIRKLKVKYGLSSLGITASTGLAASNINGETINRFSGIGLGNEDASVLIQRILKNKKSVEKWKNCRVLIIDEISMIDANLFDKLNKIAKKIRLSDKPFGGIQVILTGDFLQLPPVDKSGSTLFCFKSRCWDEVINEQILLTKVFRQQGDQNLISLLNCLRIGKITKEIESQFKKFEREKNYTDGIDPTELYPTRDEVEKSNYQKLNKLSGTLKIFQKKDIPLSDEPVSSYIEKQLDLQKCPRILELKKGAQVMSLVNDYEDTSIVNGTLGIVITFITKRMYDLFILKFSNNFKNNLNLLLFIGDYIENKNSVDIDYFKKSNNLTSYQIDTLNELIKFNSLNEPIFPLVRFSINTIDEFAYKIILPQQFKSDTLPKFAREQLPLMLSWSMSIHKSQGQTLSRVKVDLTRIFEKGQVYVALSRCVDSNHLQVINFSKEKVQVREDVLEFYRKLSE